MTHVRKIVRVYVRTLAVFASIHLCILAYRAIVSGEMGLLSMRSILDIPFLYQRAGTEAMVEVALWVAALCVGGYFWMRDI